MAISTFPPHSCRMSSSTESSACGKMDLSVCAPASQSTDASPAAASPPVTAPAGPGAATPASGKKLACQTASEALRGQAKRDQMQLCMMQARLDCLKQAIDQNIVGPQRKDFLKTCAE